MWGITGAYGRFVWANAYANKRTVCGVGYLMRGECNCCTPEIVVVMRMADLIVSEDGVVMHLHLDESNALVAAH